MRRVGVWLATVGGAGYFPVAPGTVGSAVGVAIFWWLQGTPAATQWTVLTVITLVGIWASHEAATHFNREDPGYVVIDEVAGQLVTLAFTGVGPLGMLLGFLIFRGLDIVKPWPASRFESLPGGLGIMADDVMAGLYGQILMRVAIFLLPGWL